MEKDDEVKGVGNSYDFGARMHNPRIGRWLSVDPKVSKYPELSPYHYAANNPIRYIDLNGEEIWITFTNGNGEKKEVYYSNGQIYTDASATTIYSGNGARITKQGEQKISNIFLKEAVEALNAISSTEAGKPVVKELETSKYKFNIIESGFLTAAPEQKNTNNASAAQISQTEELLIKGIPLTQVGSGTNIKWTYDAKLLNDDKYKAILLSQNGKEFKGTPHKYQAFAHELFHAYDINFGKLDRRPHSGGTLKMEWRANYFQNVVTKQLFENGTLSKGSANYRMYHGVDKLSGGPFMKDGEPVNVEAPEVNYENLPENIEK